MTYNEALGAVVYGLSLAGFLAWYIWCLYTMFFRCRRPREFFSRAYSTSGPFAFVSLVALILAAAWVLVVATN